MNIIKRIFSPLLESPHVRNIYLIAMIRPISNGIVIIATVELMKRIIEGIELGSIESTQKYFVIYIFIVCIWIVIRYGLKHYGMGLVRPTGAKYLVSKYLNKYIYADNTQVEKLGTGRIQHIMETGVMNWLNILTEFILVGTGHLTKILFSVFLIFNINILYGFAYAVITFFVLWIYITTQNKANIQRKIRKSIHVERSRDFVRLIMSKFEILQNGKIEKEIQSHELFHDKVEDCNKYIDIQRAIGAVLSIVTIDGLRVFAIAIVVYGWFGSIISTSEFVAILLVIGLLNDTIVSLSHLYVNSLKWLFNIEKLRDIFDSIGSLDGYEEGKVFEHTTGNIQLKNIGFSYTEQSGRVLSDLTISIQGGKKTALVGPSGSGKSTLVKLITGYIIPDNGSIIVDGQDLTEVSLKSYYKHIGYLTQEPSVFDGTIRDNLTYAVEHATDGELDKAIQLSKCEFVYDLPDGLDTEIGERGVRLSGGQRQRLAIAKIFLKNPEIIILDEPTSALDSFSEEAITVAMNELFKDRMVVIIAHRLQTVKHADDIILLEQGQVTERGTHTQLVEQGGKYAKMLELQSGF